MSNCNRFETEAIALLEEDQALDSHFETCIDCIEAHRQYRSLVDLLKNQSLLTPTEHWQDNVLNKTRTAKINHKGFNIKKVGALAASIALAGILTFNLSSPTSQISSIEVAVVSSGDLYRSDSAKPGDILSVTTSAVAPSKSLLRIYRNGQLVHFCDPSGASVCQIENRKLKVNYPMTAIGEYQIVLIENATLLPELEGRLDQDTLKALELNAKITLSEPTIVR